METNDIVTQLWRDYENGLIFQSESGLAKNLPMFVNFYEGKQWARATENTKNLPRPVVNIVKMICRSKKSAILASPVKIVYESEMKGVDTKKFNEFADYIQREIGQNALDKKAIDDGIKKGSYFFHYYWDPDARGKDAVIQGGVRCEIIDPLSIFFANPCETDEQKQSWIIISSRESVENVRKMCDVKSVAKEIFPDESINRYDVREQNESELCTVLTRYFRRNGEVYWEKATKNAIVVHPTPLAPDLPSLIEKMESGKVKKRGIDCPKAYLYPIVAGSYEAREKSIYGLGEVEGIIPNQKAINFNIAMALLNAQEMAWGKYIVLPNALRGQKISNEPGQVLVDYSNTGGGIRKMTETGISNQPMNIVDTLTSLTRVVSGASEVMTGEMISSGMSGAAIAALQSQAEQPIQELRNSFWLAKEKQGKVLAQFFKLYYENKEFSYDKSAEVIKAGEIKKVRVNDRFNGSDYIGVDFDVVVEVISGTRSSTASDINALDTLLSRGLISLKTYVNAYPKDALSNKSEILRGIDEDNEDELKFLKSKVSELERQLADKNAEIETQKALSDKVISIISENKNLKRMLVETASNGVLEKTDYVSKKLEANR